MAANRLSGHLSGGKYTTSHTTVIEAAEMPARAAAQLECVSKVSLGLIKTLRNGPPAIKFIPMQDVNTSELAPYPCLSNSSGRLSGHFPAAAYRRNRSDTSQLAAT